MAWHQVPYILSFTHITILSDKNNKLCAFCLKLLKYLARAGCAGAIWLIHGSLFVYWSGDLASIKKLFIIIEPSTVVLENPFLFLYCIPLLWNNKSLTLNISLQLYRTINLQVPTQDWVSLNLNAINTTRQTKFSTNRINRLKVGMNLLSNRLCIINNKIDLDWLSLSINSYKVKCKKLFLWWNSGKIVSASTWTLNINLLTNLIPISSTKVAKMPSPNILDLNLFHWPLFGFLLNPAFSTLYSCQLGQHSHL